MPARKWKWRMRGSALWLAGRLPRFSPDIIMASDFLDFATFCALMPSEWINLPRAVYFHENQLTYPVASHVRRDYQFGFVEDRSSYLRMLLEGDVVVSTARHEFFGIAVLEAVYAGCVPLLPARLSYPEILPATLHEECLYKSEQALVDMLKACADDPVRVRKKDYGSLATQFSWEKVAVKLDDALAGMV